jgi:DNA-binding MarR family transcriptional regulator
MLLAAERPVELVVTTRLEADGWIRRDDHPRDRRGKEIALIDEGRALVDRAVEEHFQNEARLLAELPPEMQAQPTGLLRELVLALGDRAS